MAGTENMKRIATLAIVLLAVSALPAGAGMFGATGSEWKEDQWTLGVGYFRSETKFKFDSSGSDSVTVRRSHVYLESAFNGYGFGEKGVTFLRLGAADFDDGKGFSDDYKAFGSLGIRDAWPLPIRTFPLTLGTIVQASYYGEAKATSGTTSASVKSNWEASFAATLQAEARKGILLYAGPFVAYGSAKLSSNSTAPGSSGTLKEKDAFGGVFGAKAAVLPKVSVDVEGQVRGKTSLGASVAYSF